MKVYEDGDKIELVAEIPENGIFSLLDWEGAEYILEMSLLTIPIRPGGSDEVLDILVAASAEFGTVFDDVCNDLIELCINTANAESFLYVDDGVNDDVWGYVELSNEEFFEITNKAYELMKGRV